MASRGSSKKTTHGPVLTLKIIKLSISAVKADAVKIYKCMGGSRKFPWGWGGVIMERLWPKKVAYFIE